MVGRCEQTVEASKNVSYVHKRRNVFKMEEDLSETFFTTTDHLAKFVRGFALPLLFCPLLPPSSSISTQRSPAATRYNSTVRLPTGYTQRSARCVRFRVCNHQLYSRGDDIVMLGAPSMTPVVLGTCSHRTPVWPRMVGVVEQCLRRLQSEEEQSPTPAFENVVYRERGSGRRQVIFFPRTLCP